MVLYMCQVVLRDVYRGRETGLEKKATRENPGRDLRKREREKKRPPPPPPNPPPPAPSPSGPSPAQPRPTQSVLQDGEGRGKESASILSSGPWQDSGGHWSGAHFEYTVEEEKVFFFSPVGTHLSSHARVVDEMCLVAIVYYP